jgi:hypothetical protein
MRIRILAFTVVLSLLIATVSAFAHHADVAYETKSIVLNEATIVSVAWVNPHGIVTCETKGEDGKAVRWVLEMGSPSAMQEAGWNRNSLTTGNVVKIDINPAKNGTHFGRLLRATFTDGKVLNYREPK